MGPVYAKKLVRAFGEQVFDIIETTPDRLREVEGIGPKTPEEKAEDFAYADDPTFSTIRRKLARWAADNVSVIKELKPPQPPGFNNRLSANWKLPLQIAQHAVVVGPNRHVVLPYTFLALPMSPAWEFSSSRHCGRCLRRTARR